MMRVEMINNKKNYSINLHHLFSCFIILSISFFTVRCSHSRASFYDFNYQLTEKIAKSSLADLSFQIPKGWFLAENNEDESTDIWLVNDNYSASIKISNINLNEDAKQILTQNRLNNIVDMTKSLLKFKLGKNFKGFKNEEEFDINGEKIIAFEYINENSYPERVVVFQYKNKFYVINAFAKSLSELNEVFIVQNTIVKSMINPNK